MSIITQGLYDDYKSLINKGHSQRSVCTVLGVSRGTMQNYLKKLDNNESPKVAKVTKVKKAKVIAEKEYEYLFISRKDSLVFVVENEFIEFKLASRDLIEAQAELIVSLPTRSVYTMTQSELDLLLLEKVPVAVKKVKNWCEDNFEIKGSFAYFRGMKVSDSLYKVIKSLSERDDVELKNFIKFMESLAENPDESKAQHGLSITDRLYDFMLCNSLQLDDKGRVLAYKAVRTDFFDHYSGTFDNSVGNIVKMYRDKVDADPNSTCSNGLHVCSESYLSNYSNASGVVVRVAIEPKHFVSIPIEYGDSKARVEQYEVLHVVEIKEKVEVVYYGEDDDTDEEYYYDGDQDDDEDENW